MSIAKWLLLASLVLAAPGVWAADKPIIGWQEPVHIDEANILLEAKLDTGADVSSLQARILKAFVRDGERWVRFRVRDRHGHKVVLERQVMRYARIKRKLAPSLRRPVVMLGICLGSVYRKVEVNLAERKNFKYHVLIGRNYLRGTYLVDSSLRHTTLPVCTAVRGD